MVAIGFEVDPDKIFSDYIRDALKYVDDLSPVFRIMAREWYRGNKAMFTLKGPGQFAPFKSPGGGRASPYVKRKRKVLGSEYPMLRGFTGKLEASITKADAVGAVSLIGKRLMIIGTRVTSKDGAPYPAYLQLGTKRMAARPFIRIGAEQSGGPDHNKRLQLWTEKIRDYVIAQMNKKTMPMGENE